MSTKKSLKKSASKKSHISDERELRKIELLLGEDFETLNQARKELAKQSKKAAKTEAAKLEELRHLKVGRKYSYEIEPVKRVPKAKAISPSEMTELRRKRNYQLYDLTRTQRRSLNQYLIDGRLTRPIGKELLQPGQAWAFSINGSGSYALFAHLDDAFEQLTRYQSLLDWANKRSTSIEQVYDLIKIIRFGKGNEPLNDNINAWVTKKKNEIRTRKEKLKELKKNAAISRKRGKVIVKQRDEIDALKKSIKIAQAKLKKAGIV